MATTMNPPVGALGDAWEPQPPARTTRAERSATDHAPGFGADFVRQNEFRLFKWLATFLVAAVAAAIALLYQQTAELRVEMERLRTDMVQELNHQHTAMREEMAHQFADVREEMTRQFADVREDIASLRERVVRVETLVGGNGRPAD